MQLKKSKSTAENELMRLINEGHKILYVIHDEYKRKIGDAHLWGISIRDWRNKVHANLIAIFPDTLEADTFDFTPKLFSLELFKGNLGIAFENAENIITKSIQTLSQFKDIQLGEYADEADQDNKQEPLSGQFISYEIAVERMSTPITDSTLS